jgi:uncharacterized protein YcbX
VPVRELWRYPVKSLGGESIQTVRVLLRGLEGDRSHGLLGPESRPVTAREAPALLRFRARFRPDQPPLVDTPDGRRHAWGARALDAALVRAAGSCRAYTVPAGAYDAWPLLLLGTGSVRAVGEGVGRCADVRRFRPNVVAEIAEPFAEDDWIGRVVVLGDAIVRVLERCSRCSVVSVDPESGDADPAVLDYLRRERDGCLGVYCEILTPGRVSIGSGVAPG